MQRGGSHTCKGLVVLFYTLCYTNLNTSTTHIRREHQAMGQLKMVRKTVEICLLLPESENP